MTFGLAGAFCASPHLAAPAAASSAADGTEIAGLQQPKVLHVIVGDDIVGYAADGAESVDASGVVRLMTDGAGLISHDLAALIPAVANGRRTDSTEIGELAEIADAPAEVGAPASAPLTPQVRLWHGGLLAKGTLCTAAAGTLPPRTIILRRSSMVKVAAPEAARGEESESQRLRADFSRFEVCDTGEKAPRARLSASLIELLAAGARRRGGDKAWERLRCHFLHLQNEDIHRMQARVVHLPMPVACTLARTLRVISGGGQHEARAPKRCG